jgi:hypothetical protein
LDAFLHYINATYSAINATYSAQQARQPGRLYEPSANFPELFLRPDPSTATAANNGAVMLMTGYTKHRTPQVVARRAARAIQIAGATPAGGHTSRRSSPAG